MPALNGYVPTTDGLQLYFQQAGEGLPALVIPNGPPLLDAFSTLTRGRAILAYDARNRGESSLVRDEARKANGIYNDVDDIEAVRSHFNLPTIDLLGHSYMGLTVILYAMRYPQRVRRIVQIGAVAPTPATQYPPELSFVDAVFTSAMDELKRLTSHPGPTDTESMCKRFWQAIRPIYVVNPADVGKLDSWQRCHLATERGALNYVGILTASYMGISLTPADVTMLTMPVLTIHGRKDRSGPYGGACDWTKLLPNGRLLTIEEGGHMPWIEAPAEVLSAIERFLQ